MTRMDDPQESVFVAPALAPLWPRPDPETAETQTLPRDHPHWVRDTVSISSRARALFATLKPIATRVLSFWDHAIRSLTVRGGTLRVDPSGSYRFE